MSKKFITFITLLWTTALHANSSPLGIELNKATLEDVKKSYRILNSVPNSMKGYYTHFLDIQNIQMDTLSEVLVISNDNKIIEGVMLMLDKNKFDEFNKVLSDKYKVLSSNIPFVGDKNVRLQDGDCYILLDAPHMSFTMDMIYATKHLISIAGNRTDKERQEKKEKIKEML